MLPDDDAFATELLCFAARAAQMIRAPIGAAQLAYAIR